MQPGKIVTGTVAAVHNFGVFVHLDGEPEDLCTGFIRVPDLTWSWIEHPSKVAHPGQRITAEVIVFDTRQGQVTVSLKALLEDPLVRFADRVGQVLSGPVTKIVPFGVFVRLADGVEGLLHLSELTKEPTETPDQIVSEGHLLPFGVAVVPLARRGAAPLGPAGAGGLGGAGGPCNFARQKTPTAGPLPAPPSTRKEPSPRAREAGWQLSWYRSPSEASPRARGTDHAPRRRAPRRGFIPARGGTVAHAVGHPAAVGFIPACAGAGPGPAAPTARTRVHPRVRGRQSQVRTSCCSTYGSSPRAGSRLTDLALYSGLKRVLITFEGRSRRRPELLRQVPGGTPWGGFGRGTQRLSLRWPTPALRTSRSQVSGSERTGSSRVRRAPLMNRPGVGPRTTGQSPRN
ncbi:S1 RNA-binding domain-containing protein [Streptomyces sp. NPDC056756]|uniref:S1 RNA-binding domain-containing protein n=1 Tax=Streptomyces sp. NPDC056756 TaxID=3345938 RepID=UPI0036A91ED7